MFTFNAENYSEFESASVTLSCVNSAVIFVSIYYLSTTGSCLRLFCEQLSDQFDKLLLSGKQFHGCGDHFYKIFYHDIIFTSWWSVRWKYIRPLADRPPQLSPYRRYGYHRVLSTHGPVIAVHSLVDYTSGRYVHQSTGNRSHTRSWRSYSTSD